MSLGRMLFVVGLVLAGIGLLAMLGDRLGLGRLPGDLVFRHKGLTIAIPIVSSIVLSVLLTIVLNLIDRK